MLKSPLNKILVDVCNELIEIINTEIGLTVLASFRWSPLAVYSAFLMFSRKCCDLSMGWLAKLYFSMF